MSQRKYGYKKHCHSYCSKGKLPKQQAISQKIDDMISFASNHFDPLGSYTGNPADPLDTPIQDADDL